MVTEPGRFGSGRSVRRVEDDALLRGEGRFADNVKVDGELHAHFVRSPHAHARIAAVDVRAARALPGVLAIYTGGEVARAGVAPLPGRPPKKIVFATRLTFGTALIRPL